MSNLIAHKIHEEQYESLERSKEEPKEWIFPKLLFFFELCKYIYVISALSK